MEFGVSWNGTYMERNSMMHSFASYLQLNYMTWTQKVSLYMVSYIFFLNCSSLIWCIDIVLRKKCMIQFVYLIEILYNIFTCAAPLFASIRRSFHQYNSQCQI